jgi:hypothetical protein
VDVYVEAGPKRVFACAVDWPGWCRSGKSEESALETLAAYAPRFAVIAAQAGLKLGPTAARRLEVVERVPGSASTDFGVPGSVAEVDRRPLRGKDATRYAALVAAGWSVLDRVVEGAPASLRKGPRGGGRDRDAIVTHVIGAEVAYARKAGVRIREPDRDDRVAVEAARAEILAAIVASSDAAWPARYLARRTAWHAVDHAWEIEDRSEPS